MSPASSTSVRGAAADSATDTEYQRTFAAVDPNAGPAMVYEDFIRSAASEELNCRRFFDVTTLAGVRVEALASSRPPTSGS